MACLKRTIEHSKSGFETNRPKHKLSKRVTEGHPTFKVSEAKLFSGAGLAEDKAALLRWAR